MNSVNRTADSYAKSVTLVTDVYNHSPLAGTFINRMMNMPIRC